jgi:glycosyltransferase EpsE
MNKKVSILMSVFNSSRFLDKSVSSILNQTYENFEFLIVDDGSEDDSLSILKKFEMEDNRIKVFQNINNIGLTKSLNFLADKAEGSFIGRQDADDISLENRLEKQINFIQKNNLDACSTMAVGMSSKSKIHTLSNFLPLKFVLKIKNPFIHGTLIIKKNIFYSIGGYDEKFYYSQDYKLMSDLISSNYKVRILQDPLYLLNQKNNISTNNKFEQKYYADCVRKNLIPNKNDL